LAAEEAAGKAVAVTADAVAAAEAEVAGRIVPGMISSSVCVSTT
jgi:hypothetical protein